MCDILIMVYSKQWPYYLPFAIYFRVWMLKIAIFAHYYDCRHLAEEHLTI